MQSVIAVANDQIRSFRRFDWQSYLSAAAANERKVYVPIDLGVDPSEAFGQLYARAWIMRVLQRRQQCSGSATDRAWAEEKLTRLQWVLADHVPIYLDLLTAGLGRSADLIGARQDLESLVETCRREGDLSWLKGQCEEFTLTTKPHRGFVVVNPQTGEVDDFLTAGPSGGGQMRSIREGYACFRSGCSGEEGSDVIGATSQETLEFLQDTYVLADTDGGLYSGDTSGPGIPAHGLQALFFGSSEAAAMYRLTHFGDTAGCEPRQVTLQMVEQFGTAHRHTA